MWDGTLDTELIICDICDKAYGFNCVLPKIDQVPEAGTSWICGSCLDCNVCNEFEDKKEARLQLFKKQSKLQQTELRQLKLGMKTLIGKLNYHLSAIYGTKTTAIFAQLKRETDDLDVSQSKFKYIFSIMRDFVNFVQEEKGLGKSKACSERIHQFIYKLGTAMEDESDDENNVDEIGINSQKSTIHLQWGTKLGDVCQLCKRHDEITIAQHSVLEECCRICSKRWIAGVDDQEMVQCGLCYSWIHNKCDKATLTKSIVDDMNNGTISTDYICPVCRPNGYDGVEYGKKLAFGHMQSVVRLVQEDRTFFNEQSKFLESLNQTEGDDSKDDDDDDNIKIVNDGNNNNNNNNNNNGSSRSSDNSDNSNSDSSNSNNNISTTTSAPNGIKNTKPASNKSDSNTTTNNNNSNNSSSSNSSIRSSNNANIKNKRSKMLTSIGKYAALNGYCTPVPSDNSDEDANNPAWCDERRCMFCGTTGENEIFGRFLPASTGGAKRKNTVHTEWYHSKCGLWSSETIETGSGVLRYIRNAIKRAKARNGTSTCSLCNGIGATIGCCSSHCKRSYHVHCAKKANLWSSTNNVANETYCFEHVSLCPHPIRMPNLNDNRMLLSAPADRIIMDVVDNSNNNMMMMTPC